PSTLKIEYGDLPYFPVILAEAPEDPKLARLLWEVAVQYKDDHTISEGRKRMANSALRYIERCGIFIPEHAHRPDCLLCGNYKPTFLTPSPEPEETTQYTISTPDEPGASRSGPPSSSQPKIPTVSPVATDIASSSSSSRVPSVRSSLVTTRNRAAILSPSATRHLPKTLSTSSLSPGARSSSSGTRPKSAEPSTSTPATHRFPNRLSTTSGARPSSATSSNPSLLPCRPSAPTLAQASTGSLPQAKGRHGQPVQQTSTKRKTSKRPICKPM
ncbi:hypothetical protein BJ912DRAFT_38795, partial [Pholiota molesta]